MEVQVPHVVILPFPAQGHVKPLFMLAKLLCHAGLNVTFVNTHHAHTRILHLIDQPTFYNLFPTFRFMSIPDGLPLEHPRTGPRATELFDSIRLVSKPSFKDLMVSLRNQEKPPSCIIADGIMSFAIDVAEELHIPLITFLTYNATCTWVYFHLHKLIQIGEIPLQGDEDMDQQITCIPGLETFMRRRDLPSICRSEIENPFFQFLMGQTSKMTRASALILNTFEELEPSMVSQLRSIFPKIYTVGTLHGLLEILIRC